jgi:putative membrane protein
MPSERRLHPLSFLFVVGGQFQQFLVPGLLVLVGAGSAGLDWQAWLPLVLIPYAAVAIVRSASFRYRFDESELVTTTGFIFRNERHVPYARIQNIDAVQNVFHRLLRVVEVRVETGGGQEPEAKMVVLPQAALQEIRERVFAGRAEAVPRIAAPAESETRRTLLRLGLGDLMLAGFIDSRGMVIAGATFGLLWEVGLFDPTMDLIFGENAAGRGIVRDVVRGFFGGGIPSLGRIALMLGAFAALVLVMRLTSMAWSFFRLYGFTLDRVGDDLRAQFGLFTRVMSTIPLHRIQTLTIREGPLHRLFGRASVRVDSAGSEEASGSAVKRESLAPIIRREQLPGLLREVLIDVDADAVTWRPVDPRGFRRALKASIVFAMAISAPFVVMLKWWTLGLLAMLLLWAYVHARLYVKHLGWALASRLAPSTDDPKERSGAARVEDGAILFRSGYLWRHVTIARFTKIQAVTLSESPFDRRARMARVRVDTAGASDASHRVDVPYLARDTAARLFELLAGEAARTAFRW